MATTATSSTTKKQSSWVRITARVLGLLVIFGVGAGLIGVNTTLIAKGFQGRAQVAIGLLDQHTYVGTGAADFVGEQIHNGVTAEAEANLVKTHQDAMSPEKYTSGSLPKLAADAPADQVAALAKLKASLQTGDFIRSSLSMASLADNTATAFVVEGFKGLGVDLLVIFAAAGVLVIVTRPKKA